MSKDLKQMYKTVMDDHFPSQLEISFIEDNQRQTLFYEKVTWTIDNVKKGLRYGENPGQEAALYRLINGNLILADTQCIQPGNYLVSDIELLQSGKHPGKTNLTDADNALNILRYFSDTPTAVIVKHNNPCGVAKDNHLLSAYEKAYAADRVAAFGGCIAVNRAIDKATAEAISSQYAEVIVAPDFEDGTMAIFEKKKNLRVIQIQNIERLQSYVGQRTLDFKSLIDGGLIVQWSFVPKTLSPDDCQLASCEYKGQTYSIKREPTAGEYDDMIFGWLIESGVTSNSVIFVKNGVTIGIGTGEQDRVGVAIIATDKAYRKLSDRYAYDQFKKPLADLEPDQAESISNQVNAEKGGLIGASMISDAFFPFRDGVDVGIQQGISAVIQPGGSNNDYQSIEACNASDVTMVYTGQRSFKH
jgi:phosphoribosylaminoimidazolecarboxamide formyltransferase/IMP cyclohydrolase